MCQCAGSVIPYCFVMALPNGVVAFMLSVLYPDGSLSLFGEEGGILKETIVWSGFTFLLGFLVVFRSSQSYARWWEGCSAVHQMRAEWFEATCALNSFISHSAANNAEVHYFKEVMVRIVSLLHATALAELEIGGTKGEADYEKCAHEYELISPEDLDEESLDLLRTSKCKVELINSWLQCLVMDYVNSGKLNTAPPLLTRVFQHSGNGLIQFHHGMRLATTPFPFAYGQTCDGLMVLHWLVAPIVTSQWATHAIWAALFSFIQVFVLSMLTRIATQLANPFGNDTNDIDGRVMQEEMNEFLTMVREGGPERAPKLVGNAGRPTQEMRTNSMNCRLNSLGSLRSMTLHTCTSKMLNLTCLSDESDIESAGLPAGYASAASSAPMGDQTKSTAPSALKPEVAASLRVPVESFDGDSAVATRDNTAIEEKDPTEDDADRGDQAAVARTAVTSVRTRVPCPSGFGDGQDLDHGASMRQAARPGSPPKAAAPVTLGEPVAGEDDASWIAEASQEGQWDQCEISRV